MLKIRKSTENSTVTVTLEGRLDTLTAPSLEKELLSSLEGADSLVMDFEKPV